MKRRDFLALSASFLGVAAGSSCSSPVPDFHTSLEKKRKNARGRHTSNVVKRKKTDPEIVELLDKISRTELQRRVNQLASLGTRWTFSETNGDARDWIVSEFLDMGYADISVQLQPFRMPYNEIKHNVICAPEPFTSNAVIICAHFDSTSEKPRDAAPGADDNASGISVMLEVARVLRAHKLEKHLLYAAFSGEEQGLYGSKACAVIAAEEDWPIQMVVNLDMVGYVEPDRPTNIVIEYDQGNTKPENDGASKTFAFEMAQVAADYTNLSVEHTDIWNSDYMPFEANGYPCVGLYDEASDASFYHKSFDTPEIISIDRLVDVARIVVGSLASAVEPIRM